MLISFDVDGTLWCGGPPGPITKEVFERVVASGVPWGLCGNFNRFAKMEPELYQLPFFMGGFALLKDVGTTGKINAKANVLLAARENNVGGAWDQICIHVGDEVYDKEAARKAGWTYVEPKHFRWCELIPDE